MYLPSLGALISAATILKKGLFLERVTSNKTEGKVSFFHLGPKNNYEELLNKKIVDEIEKKFQDTMRKLNYL